MCRTKRKGFLISLLIYSTILLTGCQSSDKNSLDLVSDANTTEKTPWNNNYTIQLPSADEKNTEKCESATVDFSNQSEGYIMVNYTGENEKVKLQITGPDEVTYTYNLHGGYETFPLTSGDGSYHVGIYESIDIEANKYSTAMTCDIDVSITNSFGPYLYPNQYVNFDKDSLAVTKSYELTKDCQSDLDAVTEVYNYIISNFTYDYDKAENVKSGYVPDVDEIYQIKKGICFDYAAEMATMLRCDGIPTRLEVGYKGEAYHAWVSVYLNDIGWVNGIIRFDGKSWEIMDPTFASTSSSPKDFISENDDYLRKYVY